MSSVRFSRRTLVTPLFVLGLLAVPACVAPQPGPAPAADTGVPFADITTDSGLDFVHVNGSTGQFHLFEIMGAGVALFDYDRDGDLDVYLVQGAWLEEGDGPRAERIVQPASGPLRDRLYRNDWIAAGDSGGHLRFVDVTQASGIDARGYGMGVAVGDVDNDGWPDLYVTNFGSNQLWRNRGDGTFADHTALAGADDPRWSVAATFVDVDGDGWLDLYVGNYVDLTLRNSRACFNLVRDYCSPSAFQPVPDRLLRNRGDGTFEDITVSSRLALAYGHGLGVVSADFDLDGRIDLYVANDGSPNLCWINQGGGRFQEVGLAAGCALNQEGRAEAGMGVSAADFDDDGDEDLFLTHLRGETHTLYVNDGRGVFRDETLRFGLGSPSRPRTGFGTHWFDVDNDGDLDLLAVNGAVTALEQRIHAGDPYPYGEPDQLFRNEGGRYVEVPLTDPAAAPRADIGRGAAFGDLDNDGDVDVVVANNSGPARVLLNQAGPRRAGLGLHLTEPEGREAYGAWVGVRAGAGPWRWRRVRSDGSYASAGDPRLHFGLGTAAGPLEIRVRWPDGTEDRHDLPEAKRWITLTRGGAPNTNR